VDGSGNLYVTDAGSVRKISSNGVVTTLAGRQGGLWSQGFVNGTGTNASFRDLNGVTVDGFGNVYVADTGNHAIRKITSNGVVTATRR